MGPFYQYANRLAHLYLLRTLNQVDAYLIFTYFLNASEVAGPNTVSEWTTGIQEAHSALAIGQGPLTPFVREVFIDVDEIADA